MSTRNYYENLIKNIAKRSVEATISILGITDKGLRKHLINELGGNKDNFGLLADPVFESMFPWEKSESTMNELSGKLLESSLVDAMDNAGGHRFGRDWYPFKHQLNSWNTLLDSSCKSLVVTSGTGSGKTECFMVPILNDLVREYNESQTSLVGVRALFIYPLNALINSQRERLRAWTEAFDDGLRFCLYNGNTAEQKHKDQNKYPNEILTRKILRETPAPMLVTNATMLEYMLVRQVDSPIIEQSKGKLRWIVLDEAHTYIGSQAAELSLLLRRVMHTFGVEPKNVRFVATSATIGDKDSEKQLQEYLANLSGVSLDQVFVVGGKRSVPPLPKLPIQKVKLKELLNIESDNHFSNARYDALASNDNAIKLREALTISNIPATLPTLSEKMFGDDEHQVETLEWLDICSNTSKPGPVKKNPSQDVDAFLPVRGHLFHQVLSGLWCCVDKNCTEKNDTSLLENWPFGRVYSQRRNNCECGAPIFELLFCNDCNAPHLMSMESSGSLVQMDRESVDEFSLSYESSEENDGELEMLESTTKEIIAPNMHIELTYPLSIDFDRKIVPTGIETLDLNVIISETMSCVRCDYSGYNSAFYRRSLLGTPFYISNNIPVLLDACQESDEASERPNRGRKMITFTDSRQGTARISTKIQQDSERDSIRGLIYGAAAHNIASLNTDEHEDKQKKLNRYLEKAKQFRLDDDEETAKDFDNFAEPLIKELASLGEIKTLTWIDAVNQLHASPDISRWIFDYYKDLNPLLFPDSGGARVLTEMLLLREFARRPKRQNSLETLGLVSVQYPILKEIKKAPDDWEKLGLSLTDWIDFLKVTLDFYVRENSIIDIPSDWVDWMGAKIYPKSVLKPDTDENTSSRIKKWPQVVPGRNNRLIRMLCMACNINLRDAKNKDQINNILKAAWSALTFKYQVHNVKTNDTETHQILKAIPGSVQYHLDRTEIAFQVCTEAWICPITHRLLDTVFKDITPYLPFNAIKEKVLCCKHNISVCQVDASQFDSDSDRKLAIREWADNQSDITELRDENLWTDISDRVIAGGRFYRAAEHSAQQPASKLEKYEALFKTGKLNVLSCSTTMEMGVDIGGINVVAMNNVPPHPANYLQRSGRAGRRGETQALSFTICKDNPHERGVFVNPLWPFTTDIAAPYIILNSERIVQRHINSVLLSYFLKDVLTVLETSITSLVCEWFFSHDDSEQSPVEKMLRWLASFKYEPMPSILEQGINQVVKGSILSSVSLEIMIDKSINSLRKAKEIWLPGYLLLKFELSKLDSFGDKDPYKRKVEYDLKCLSQEYLLSELASRSFLPGYGFPTGIATFDHYSISDFQRGKYIKKSGRIDNQMRMRERPGRNMAIAIREYAPGSDIVLDGLVYRSAGILLNKFAPNEDFSESQKMMKEWRCHSCGFIGNESGATFKGQCSDCGTELILDNIKEYIEPSGFAVDFYSAPTTDISSQMYVPVQEPWVTANAELSPLFEPKLGTYRSSSEGHIFNHSSGEHGTGFAICLRCGKAESMTIDGDYPENIQPGHRHLKLQGKPGPESSAWCEGPDESYAIKENVHLGATDQTDVFELYLKHPSEDIYLQHVKNDPLPWTLAVVLRQALADIHGINADEMGYTIKPSTLPGCNYPVAGIVLFDKNGGGAGFSSVAPRHLREMFKGALEHLNCSDDCDSACQSCLMGYDTRFHNDLLNRHTAISYLESIQPYLEMPPEAKLFGEESKYCMELLSSELLNVANHGGKELRLFTSGAYEDWDISNSYLKDSCLNWRNTFDSVELVIPKLDVSSLNDIHKEDLLALNNFGIKLSVLSDSTDINLHNGSLLAQVSFDESRVSFASTVVNSNIPNIEWWKLDGNYLIRSHEFKNINTVDIDKELLSIQREAGDIEVEVMSECDGPLNDFGDSLWDKLIEDSETLKATISGTNILKTISYSDCYISSPWSLILFAEIIASLKKILSDTWERPLIKLTTGNKEPNSRAKGLYAEWSNSNARTNVITEYFEQMDEQIKVDVMDMRDMPHGRTLTLHWSDDSNSVIRFDHGVGCWGIGKFSRKWFDIESTADKQVDDMFNMLADMIVKFNKKHPTQIFVKKR